jgi:hypothetical protein
MKRAFAVALLSALLIMMSSGATLNPANANFVGAPGGIPPSYFGFVKPTADTKPPEIAILSPSNNTACDGYRAVELNLGVHPPNRTHRTDCIISTS